MGVGIEVIDLNAWYGANHTLQDINLHIPANAILGVTLLALLSSNLRFATERHWLGEMCIRDRCTAERLPLSHSS